VRPADDKVDDKAQVMQSGISAGELYYKTLASKKIFDLYFRAVYININGWLGGYNF
jgi:predicted flavoprotein YhiN